MQTTTTHTQTEINNMLDMALKFIESNTADIADVYATVAQQLNITTNEAIKIVAQRYMTR